MLALCPDSRRIDLVLRHFRDGSVVYDEASGGLHAISSVAGLVLGELMTNDALTPSCLASLLQFEDPSHEELKQLEMILLELHSLGFVDCLPA